MELEKGAARRTSSHATCYLLGTPVEAVVSTGKKALRCEQSAAQNL